MATATFCSECGERLKVKRSSTLLFRSFCSRCSPRFNRARLMLMVAIALSAAIGFAIGRFTTAREPFYYIGTPVESGSSRTAPSTGDNAAPSARKSEAVVQREQVALSPSAAEGTCGARTKSGRPCQRKVKGGGYCWQHRDKVGEKK
jgi:hypothetical protein